MFLISQIVPSIILMAYLIFASISSGEFNEDLTAYPLYMPLTVYSSVIIGMLMVLWHYLLMKKHPTHTHFNFHSKDRVLIGEEKKVTTKYLTIQMIICFAVLIGMQLILSNTLNYFGLLPDSSENTDMILEYISNYPIFILSVIIVAPVIEELFFRGVLFRYMSTNLKWGFWIPSIISSLLFGIIHFDFAFLIIYTAMGMILSWFYYKTNRIIVPIMGHMGMNIIATIGVFFT